MGMYKTSTAGGFRVVSGRAAARVVIEEPAPAPESAPLDAGPGEDYQAGRRDAEEAFARERVEWEAQVARWSASIPEQLTAYLAALETQVRTEICDLAVQAAAVILGRAVPSEDLVRSALHEALGQVVGAEILRVALHPTDAERLQAALPADLPASVIWVPDPALQPGDVVVHTRRGVLDGALARRLECLKEWFQAEAGTPAGPDHDLDAADH